MAEAAVEAYTKRMFAVALGLRIGFLSLSIMCLIVSLLTQVQLCVKSWRVAYAVAWINLMGSVVGLILLIYHWTAFGTMLLRINCTLGELVVWGNLDLLYVILTAVPMTRVYASLGNVYAAGGNGFEGKSLDELASPQKKVEILQRRSLKMSRIGSWKVGLSLEHGAILWGLFCLAITIMDFSVFWLRISDDPFVKVQQIGILFLVQGMMTFVIAICALAGSAAIAPFFTLLAAFLTGLVIPLAVTLLVYITKNVILEFKAGHRFFVLNFASVHALQGQAVFVLLAFFAITALCSLFSAQTKEGPESSPDSMQRVDLEEEGQKLLTAATEP